MLRVKSGGRELLIEDELVAEYLAKGYSVIDKEGNVVQKGNVTTLGQAIEEIRKLTKENENLKAENASLQKTITKLKKEAKKAE